ncbi:MAG TPA: UDP-3-O-acyl-N-acetylglucosamine deacetylase [Acidobacteriota bacterium]
MQLQQTISREIRCVGVGLHSGQRIQLVLKPAPADSGITFRRTDVSSPEIPARLEFVSDTNHATTLSRGRCVLHTVEHLLAAAWGLGVDNLRVELDAAEVPIMDGSSAPFVYLLREAGIRHLPRPRRYIKIQEPIGVTEGDKSATLYPHEGFTISYTIRFDHPLIRRQFERFRILPSSFADEIAPARTFGFLSEAEALRKAGLIRGGSLDNAIVLTEAGLLNPALRFKTEFVRHKVLDAVGDLALIGMPILGHLVAYKGGHTLHAALANEVLKRTESWSLVTRRELRQQGFLVQPATSRAAAYRP